MIEGWAVSRALFRSTYLNNDKPHEQEPYSVLNQEALCYDMCMFVFQLVHRARNLDCPPPDSAASAASSMPLRIATLPS